MLIYVVDDEHAIASTSSIIVRQAGYEAQAFFDASSALTAAARFAPNLILTDINMPHMNGLELAAEVNLLYPFLRDFIVSGSKNYQVEEDIEQSAKGWSFLSKPLRTAELLKRIETMLHKQSSLAELPTMQAAIP